MTWPASPMIAYTLLRASALDFRDLVPETTVLCSRQLIGSESRVVCVEGVLQQDRCRELQNLARPRKGRQQKSCQEDSNEGPCAESLEILNVIVMPEQHSLSFLSVDEDSEFRNLKIVLQKSKFLDH